MHEQHLGEIRYSIDHGKRILFAERRDVLNKRAVYAEWQAIRELDGFDPSYDTLVDYSGVTEVDLDYSDLKQLNEDMPKLDPRTGHVAIVTGLLYGRYLMGKFFCLIANLATSRKHKVFQNSAEAEVWLLSLRE